jgi:hypothetical protein
MNRCHEDDYDDEDAMLNDSISEGDPDGMSLADDDELDLSRIEEFRHAALRQDDPLRAVLGARNAGLLKIASHYEAVIANALQSAKGSILESPHFHRAITVQLNIVRQADRLANLDLRMEEGEREADNNALRRMSGVPASARAASRRGRI